MKHALTALALFIVRILSYLPPSIRNNLGSLLGVIGFYAAKKRRNIGIKNLSLCFPQMTQKEKEQLIKSHFKYLATSVLEYGLVFYADEKKLKHFIHLKNFHYVTEHYQKQPIILLCPHFVGLDLAAIRITLEISGYTIYSQQKNSLIGEKLKEARMRFMHDSGGAVFARRDGLRGIVKLLRETKRALYYLPDQDLGERDSIYIPFFSFPTCATINALPKITQLTNALVIPLVVYKVKDHYEVEFYPPWLDYPSGNLYQDVLKMNKCIEMMVLQHKAQYFWLHKRFKTQPDSERGSLYRDC